MKNVITKVRRQKMAEASHTTGKLAKAKWIALGSGGVDASGNIITPLADNVKLYHEVIVRSTLHQQRHLIPVMNIQSNWKRMNLLVPRFQRWL